MIRVAVEYISSSFQSVTFSSPPLNSPPCVFPKLGVDRPLQQAAEWDRSLLFSSRSPPPLFFLRLSHFLSLFYDVSFTLLSHQIAGAASLRKGEAGSRSRDPTTLLLLRWHHFSCVVASFFRWGKNGGVGGYTAPIYCIETVPGKKIVRQDHCCLQLFVVVAYVLSFYFSLCFPLKPMYGIVISNGGAFVPWPCSISRLPKILC